LANPVNGHGRYGLVNIPENPVAIMALVHGFGEHCERYTPMMDHLAANKIGTVTIDLEGHGRSEGKKGVCHDYEILRGDVDLLLSEASSRGQGCPLFLYGHSMGGGLVLNYGLTRKPHNLAGVISSAPLIESAIPVPQFLFWFVKRIRKLLPNATMRQKIPGGHVNSLPEAQAAYEADPLNHDRLGTGLGIDIIDQGAWVASEAASWTLPLLLMHAQADKLTRFDASEAFAASAKNCTFLPMENTEHEMHNDVVRDDVYKAMTDFILERS